MKSKTHTTGNEVSLRLNYQPKWGNIDLHASWQLYRSNNLLTNTHVNTIDYDCGISGTVELPHDIEIWAMQIVICAEEPIQPQMMTSGY